MRISDWSSDVCSSDLQSERLIENAAAMGEYLSEGLNDLKRKYPKIVLDVRGRGLFQAIRLNFQQDLASKLVDISKNPLFRTYQTVLIAGLTRDLYEIGRASCRERVFQYV